MRLTFINTLADLAQSNPNIVLLTADLGYGALEPFRDRFPERFINVGVAEQNMIGIATDWPSLDSCHLYILLLLLLLCEPMNLLEMVLLPINYQCG